MAEQTSSSPDEDSLDIVERVMAIEEEIEARIASGEFGYGNDFDDDALAAWFENSAHVALVAKLARRRSLRSHFSSSNK